jgi:hypothetical protein
MVPDLYKSRILSHRQCPKRLWLQVHRPDLLEESVGRSERTNGIALGELARRQIPNGVLIDAADLRTALRQTAQALAAKPRRPVFEAAFEHEGVLVRADLLLPAARGWRMVEVKSSTEIKGYQVEDAAVQIWVIQGAGVPLRGKAISYVDNGFVYPGNGDYDGLFAEEDVDSRVSEVLPEVPEWVAAARRTLARRKEPDVEPGAQCEKPFACPFQAHCIPESDGYPVGILPYGGKLITQLCEEGYEDLRDVPRERLSNPVHLRIWKASRSGRAIVDPALGEAIRGLTYPRYFLDFETLNPAIPIWEGTRPYQHIPFQWSCHIQDADGLLRHEEFLAEGADDPRRALTLALLALLGTKGPILMWSHFERDRLRDLATALPEFARRIDKIVARLVDLKELAREHYYHPAMMGSWSVKNVLPTIAPKLSYDDLEVANGMAAQQAFSELLSSDLAEKDRQSLRRNLLEYCKRDTLAMVKIAQRFSKA